MLLTIIIFVVVLAALILVHELGHFLLAKRSGIKVEEFGVGFPPRIWGKRIGETVYSINLIPLGGFVRLYGEEKEIKGKRSFSAQPIFTRAKVVFSGVLMNFLFGFLILLVYFGLGNPPVVSDPARFVSEDRIEYRTIVLEVKEGSAAEKAGVEPGFFISQVDDQSVAKVEDLTKYTEARANQEVRVIFGPNGQPEIKTITLDNIEGKGRLGVMVGQTYGRIGYSWWQVPWAAVEETGRITGLIFFYVYKILQRLITEGQVEEGVVGPVGIFMLTKQVVQLGLAPVLRFVAFLSINLGVVNLLPLPALDGGQLVILGFEKVRGRRIRKNIESGLQIFGFAILIILILLITYRDVVRLFQ